MLTGLEEFLFRKFKYMPPWVRIFTYLFILFLFAYLLLVPRFINGRLELHAKTGGWRPYRAGVLQMHVDGRVYKFQTSRDGYWSIPNVSLLPHVVRLEVYHRDQDLWFPLQLRWSDLWMRDLFRVAVTNQPPGIKLIVGHTGNGFPSTTFAGLGRMADVQLSTAIAGEPPPSLPASGDPQSAGVIEAEVVSTIHSVTGKTVSLTSPFTGPSAPMYSERIAVIETLEDKFNRGMHFTPPHLAQLFDL